MSNCNKDLFDYDLVKKCCRCKIILLKSNFNKNKTKIDGVQNICIICFKQYHNNRKESRNILDKQRRKTDFNYKLAHNIRVRTRQAFKSQNVEKLNKTFDLIDCSQLFLRKWILYQLYSDMTQIYGEIWCLDPCHPLSKTNLSDKNELYKSTIWVNLRPMYMKDNLVKGDKNDHRLYLLQQIKAKYFMKLNVEEGLNEDLY